MDTQGKMRLVHLDLKGAPPKVTYYEQIFPLLKKWGATGLLIEYEDMFPYYGELKEIAAPNAHSPEEIQFILELCAAHDFTVIPLVQTFGHFEFVLKHDKFRQLREVPNYPMTLCPRNEDSMKLVQKMIDQVVALHPGLRWFHIGADEVFHLGTCKRCHSHMQTRGLAFHDMFFEHVRNVLIYIRDKYPHLKAIMWDDKFRDLDPDIIKESGLGGLVEPMIWYYQKTFSFSNDMWDAYSQVFDSLWVATAFKGATGPCMFVTDSGYHIENHRGWIAIMNQQAPKFKNFRGYCLTGWQRYDHYSVLCELLPVGLPSLALCLLTLKHSSFTEDVHRQASSDLGFVGLMPLNPFKSVGDIPECNFPGSSIYVGAQALLFFKQEYKTFMGNDRLNGWFTDYHVKHNYSNPAHVKHFLHPAKQIQEQFLRLEGDLTISLSEVFYPDAVDEWLEVNLRPKLKKISELVSNAEEQIAIGAKVKDYHVQSLDQADRPMQE